MVIDARHFSFSYPNSEAIINDLSFTLEEGEIMLLVGENGCGKSTLLRSLKKEISPKGKRGGTIEIMGSSAYLFQQCDKNIIFRSPYEDLIFPACNAGIPQSEIEKSAEETIDLFSLREVMKGSTDELSGGEKQLISLASLIITKPDLLILDEPLSQLDEDAKRTFVEMLKTLNKKFRVSIIIAEHNTDELFEMSDKIMSFSARRIDIYARNDIPQDFRCDNFPEYVKEEFKLNVKPESFTKSEACEKLSTIKDKLIILPHKEKKLSGKVILKCENITFSYDKELLKNLDLSIREGEVSFLLGKNGAGKSTLFRIICHTLKAKCGKIETAEDVKVGYLSQNPVYSFLKDKLCDDFAFLCEKNNLPESRVEEKFAEFPMYADLKKLLNMNPLDLSGGETAKATMFKQLLIDKNLVLLDEPEKHLDKKSAAQLAAAIKDLSLKGISFLIISHTPDFIYSAADSINFLQDGKITNYSVSEFFDSECFTNLRCALEPAGIKANSVSETEAAHE